MQITLKGDEVDHYLALRNLDRRVDALVHAVNLLVTTLPQTIGAAVSQQSDALNAKLDGLAEKVAAARDKVVQTVEAESEEDRQQNALLAAKQAEIDELRAQLGQATTPAEVEALTARIDTLSDEVLAIANASTVTDPNTPPSA